MSEPRRGVPLVPQWPNLATTIVRAGVAHLLAHRTKREPSVIAAKNWRDAPSIVTVIKGAVTPDVLASNVLGSTVVPDVFVGLSPASAAANVLSRAGVQVSFGGAASIVVPSVVADAGNGAFLGEGAPLPVQSATIAGPTLLPHKLGVITTYTNEILQHSIPDIESVVRVVLGEALGLTLDAYLFDANAGSSVRPAGLRYGINALGASTLTSTPLAAAVEDLGTLIGAVSSVGGNAPAAIVASPKHAAILRLLPVGPNPGFEVFATSKITAGNIIAIAPAALAVAADVPPEFQASTEVLIHLDSAPAQIADGSPATFASPTRSMFQTDCVGLKLKLRTSWALRDAGGLAWLAAGW